MNVKFRKIMAQYNVSSWKNFSLKHTLALLWIDVRYGIEEWLLKKTAKLRLKYTKRLRLSSMAYYSDHMGWDDVDVSDQWGLWIPYGFGLVAKSQFDFDQQINRDIGQPEDEWKDFIDGDWPTYYFKDEVLNSNHYFDAARKHFRRLLKDESYDRDIELVLRSQSQKSLDDDTKQYIDWVANGSKPFKVQFSDQAKEDMTRILGEEDAKKLFDDVEERNKKIDNPDQGKEEK